MNPGHTLRLGLFFAFGALALALTSMPTAAAQAQGPTVYTVEIGHLLKGVAAESMAFYPSSLKVRSGDVIRFTNTFESIPETGIHAALALPPDVDPDEWEEQNARNLDGEWAFFQSDPDDDAGRYPTALKGNWKTILPTDLSCGSPDNPCTTGTSPSSQSPLNSGVSSPLDFSVKIEAEPGTRIWFLCAIHTKMKMKVDVVGDDEATSTLEDIERRNAAKLLQETEEAKRLDRKFTSRRRPYYVRTAREHGTHGPASSVEPCLSSRCTRRSSRSSEATRSNGTSKTAGSRSIR